MQKVTRLFSAALGVILAASASQGAVLLTDNFDGYANQAAFQASWPVVTAESGTLTSTPTASSAPNSIQFGVNPSVARNQKTFTATGVATPTNLIEFSFDFYDSNHTAAPYRGHHNLQVGAAPTGSGQLISMGLQNTQTFSGDGGNYYMARILGYDGGTGASAYFKLNQGPASTLRSTGWRNLKAIISPTDVKFYVDGILASTEVTTLANNDSYTHVRIGSGITSANAYGIDNVKVEVVPEPTSLAVLALGGLGLLARRRTA